MTPLHVLQSYIKAVLFYFILKASNSFQTPALSRAGSERLLEFAFKKCAIVGSVLCVSFCCLFFGSSGSDCATLLFRHQREGIERFLFLNPTVGDMRESVPGAVDEPPVVQ